MSFSLTDDGTLDTMIACDDCGQEERYNFSEHESEDCDCYDNFVAWAIEDANDSHECHS